MRNQSRFDRGDSRLVELDAGRSPLGAEELRGRIQDRSRVEADVGQPSMEHVMDSLPDCTDANST